MAVVLIVDDDPTQSAPLAALLRREGHEAVCADSAGEARRRLREGIPDLLLVDIMMPTTNGLEAMDALTEEPAFADVRFAVFSASDDPAFIAEARRLGACAYIHKGQSWEAIHEHLRPHLGGRSATASTPASAEPAVLPVQQNQLGSSAAAATVA